jgi:DNA/RNA-binding domain of Phe-tRNA-synthetase-like protein
MAAWGIFSSIWPWRGATRTRLSHGTTTPGVLA